MKFIVVLIQLLCRRYIHRYNRHCKCRLLAFHNHMSKLNLQCLLHSHMLDRSCKMDHVHGFKTLSKKSQRYTNLPLILRVMPKNHSCEKVSKEFVTCCSLLASDSILVISLSRSNPVFNI